MIIIGIFIIVVKKQYNKDIVIININLIIIGIFIIVVKKQYNKDIVIIIST